jgi:PAS domain S-box-containing protein
MLRLRPSSIVLIFALASGVWILCSDQLAAALFSSSPEAFLWASILKGWFYVGVASLLLYSLVRAYERGWLRKEEALRASEERFRLLFEAAPLPMILSAPDGTNLLINTRFTDTFGYAPEQVRCEEDWWPLVYPDPDYRKEVQAQWSRNLDRLAQPGAAGARIIQEARCACADGTVLSILFTCAPVGSNLLILFQDITAIREAEEGLKRSVEEKNVLLKEVHHRVKNNLQIISSLLFLQATQVADPKARELFAESQNRILAMSLVHEELYRSRDLASVSMRGLITNLVQRLMDSGGQRARVDLKLEEATLPVTKSLPCGMAVNELVTNAIKHGLGLHGDGELAVHFRHTTDGYELLVADNGPGIPPDVDFAAPRTLGLTLVRSLADQLQGSITYENAGGARFVLTFPA